MLKKTMGAAEIKAMYVNLRSNSIPRNAIATLTATSDTINMSDIFVRNASLGFLTGSSE